MKKFFISLLFLAAFVSACNAQITVRSGKRGTTKVVVASGNGRSYSSNMSQYKWGEGLATAGWWMCGISTGVMAIFPAVQFGMDQDGSSSDGYALWDYYYKPFLQDYGAVYGVAMGVGVALIVTGSILRNTSGVSYTQEFRLFKDAGVPPALLSVGPADHGLGLMLKF